MEGGELREHLSILWNRIWLIILITIIFTVAGGIFSYYIIDPEYQTFTTLMVSKPLEYNSELNYSEILLNQQLAATYTEIVKSRAVLDEVINNLKLNIAYEKLNRNVRVIQIENTGILKIVVRHRDRQLVSIIANEVANVFIKKISEIVNMENVKVIDKARVPLTPVRPRPVFDMALSGIAGVMIGIFVVFLIEYLDNTIADKEDIKKYLELPVIGEIPKISGDSKKKTEIKDKITVYEKPNSIATEAYRVLGMNIKFFNIDKNIRSLLITSSYPEEGKSTVAVNLAFTLAQSGQKIILIDCDLRKPHIHFFFPLSSYEGMTNLLNSQNLNYKDVIFSMGNGLPDVLFSGLLPPNPSEIISSERFKVVFSEIIKDYDMAIIDSPPLRLVSDAVILSNLVDGIVLICEAGKCKIDIAKNAISLVKTVKANILGAVLNKVGIEESEYNYYSSYTVE